jgi:RNA polymerase sigma-70 factor, ECF subfamily
VRRDPLEDAGALIKSVYAYVAYRIGDGPDAQDVTSETFARALRYRDSYDRRKGEPIAWLIAIARRCIIDAAARPTEELDERSAVPDAADLEVDVVRRLALREAVAQLDEAGRELVALRFGADLTARQIAELTGRKTHAVEVALQRTLLRLRDQLDENDRAAVASTEGAPVRFPRPRRYSGVDS